VVAEPEAGFSRAAPESAEAMNAEMRRPPQAVASPSFSSGFPPAGATPGVVLVLRLRRRGTMGPPCSRRRASPPSYRSG